jgi:serine/threonine protein kinase
MDDPRKPPALPATARLTPPVPARASSDSNSQCATKILPPRLATGQLLRHFRLESVLGEGGMGVVYRAFDTQLCRPVAVKVLPPELTADAERRQRFLLEARAAARISHPAVAQIFYVDEQDGITFLVMELVEGKTVRDLINSQELDLLGTVDVVTQVADGLAKAHELGIVHRDIKPANVMVTKEGHAKILDFGLAKLLDRAVEPGTSPAAGDPKPVAQTTLPGVVMGTAAYMSPEQVRGAAIDGRADIFSLGVLLFEMATGQSPFQRGSFVDSLHAVAFDQTPPLASLRGHLPDELNRIVSRCLKKQPEDRYPDAQVLARDLRLLRRNTESGLATKTSWRLRLTETWERVRSLSIGQYGWFAAVALALGFALYLSFSRIGIGGVTFVAATGIILYRRIRNRPQRMQEWFVRRVSKIPEVLLVSAHDRQFTVVVERPVAQLYTRINQHLQYCNRKLYFGRPMTVSILHELSMEKTRQLLSGPGVQFVRPDVLQGL